MVEIHTATRVPAFDNGSERIPRGLDGVVRG